MSQHQKIRTDVSPMDRKAAAWLFRGEGCITIAHNGNGGAYLSCQLVMADRQSVADFAAVFGLRCSSYLYTYKGEVKRFWRVGIAGKEAEKMLALMWPYLSGTDKGDQALRVAQQLGVEDWITGARCDERRDRRSDHPRDPVTGRLLPMSDPPF